MSGAQSNYFWFKVLGKTVSIKGVMYSIEVYTKLFLESKPSNHGQVQHKEGRMQKVCNVQQSGQNNRRFGAGRRRNVRFLILIMHRAPLQVGLCRVHMLL